jgi:ATP-dependent protease ClpP protease subunit
MKKRIELIQAADNPEILEMYIYGYIEGDSRDWWTGEIIESETSANHFKNELEKYPDVEQINLYVNSNGGLVLEAMSIRNQLKRHSANVVGYVDGFACSAASFILTGCDEVKMYSNTMQMLHLMRDGVLGNYKELRSAADDLEKISIGNQQAYLEKAGEKLTEEKVIEILENETWLTAQECLEYGLADEIIEEEKDLTEARELAQKVNDTLEQQINYNKKLVAMKQSLEIEKSGNNKTDPEPDPKPEPKQKENKPKEMFIALFNNKEAN